MSSFTNTVKSEKLPDGKRRLLESFDYHVGAEDSKEIITVEAGFISDGATIPRFLWPIIGHPWDDYEQAAWLHDWICSWLRHIYSRKEGEQIMCEASECLEVSLIKREVMYYGLRVFGWYCWNKGAKAAELNSIMFKNGGIKWPK